MVQIINKVIHVGEKMYFTSSVPCNIILIFETEYGDINCPIELLPNPLSGSNPTKLVSFHF